MSRGRLPGSTAVSRRVARGELHRTVRSIAETPREALAVLLLVAVAALLTVAGSVGAYLLGQRLQADPTIIGSSALPIGRSAIGFGWLLLAVTVAVRTFAKIGNLDPSALLLSVVPVRDLVIGKLLAEWLTLCCWLVLPIACVGGAFALGSGALAVLPALALVVPLTIGVAVPVGFVTGLGVRHLATRYEPIVRIKTPLAIALAVAYVGVFVTGRVESVFGALSGPLQRWPVSWLADALALAIPGVEPASSTALVGVGFSLAAVAVGLAVAPRLAAAHWLSDRPRSQTAPAVRASDSRLETLLAPVTDRRTRSVATTVWRRTRRSPVRLVFLLYPLFFAIEPARQTLASLQATGTVPAWVPPLVLAYVVWAAGMAFTLNPLGEQGATLPTTLSVPAGARAAVRGRLLVAVIATLPLALVLVGLAGALSPLPPAGVAGLLAAATAGTVAAAALATGIGVAFPRFGTVSVTRNRSVVVPSKTAAALYSLAVFVLVLGLAALAYEPALEALAAALSWITGEAADGIGADAIRPAVAVLFLPFALLPVLSYRYAVSRIGSYTLE